ncbi:MAG TPA: dolichyl-phosphate beta-glucosyltransferase [Anaerolineales bacterium]|nr:dolichyl-phosphate beta-glucosyltransferase [Anaerolineales bacterium]
MTYLSIIIPAHNEEQRLPETLREIDAFVNTQPYAIEVLVVENGSVDNTAQAVRAYGAEREHVRLLQEPGRGKGLAVRRGMLAAQGEFRFMCDADLSMPIEQVARFLPPQLTNFDVAIGSREVDGAVRFHEPAFTHVRGRVFSNLVKLFVLSDFEDTQCGFKCFRAQAALDLFSTQRLDGMSFDVEVLYIARKRGYRIAEVPVDWYFHRETRVRMLRDSFGMLADILAVRRNWRDGKYARPR